MSVKSTLCLTAALSALTPLKAEAEVEGSPETGRIIIIGMGRCCPDEAWLEAEAALRAELEAMDLVVAVVPSVSTSERQRRLEMRRLAEENDAACAVRIVRPPEEEGGVELWVEDRLTGKTIFREVEIELQNGDRAASLAAVRSIETLRASLIELRLEESSSTGVEIPEPLEELTEGSLPERSVEHIPFAMWFGVGVHGTPNGLGPHVPIALAARYNVLSPLALELDASVTVWADDIAHDGLATTFDVSFMRLWLLWTPGTYWRIRFALGVGAGLAIAWANGIPGPGIITRRDSMFAGMMGGRFSIGIVVTNNIEIRLDTSVSALLPEVKVLLDEVEVGFFGLPVLEGHLLFGMRLPQ
jgi:hypothetical protein